MVRYALPTGPTWQQKLVLGCTLWIMLTGGCSDILLKPESGSTPTRLEVTASQDVYVEEAMVDLQVTPVNSSGKPLSAPGWVQKQIRYVPEDPSVVGTSDSALVAASPGETFVTVKSKGLEGVEKVRVNPEKVRLIIKSATITQSVQRTDNSIPLVAGEEAVVRVVLAAGEKNFYKPGVEIIVQNDGTVVDTLDAERPTRDGVLRGVPRTVSRSSSEVWTASLPGEAVRPGLSFSVVANPNDTVPLAANSVPELPSDGSTIPVEVRRVPTFRTDLLPIRHTPTGNVGRLPDGPDALLQRVLDMFPMSEYSVRVRPAFSTSTTPTDRESWSRLLNEIEVATAADGNRYAYGLVPAEIVDTFVGFGNILGTVAVGYDDEDRADNTYAHELGHNFSLRHAPCGDPDNVDPSFPYANGLIGEVGYSTRGNSVRPPDSHHDLMTYCSPTWVSDYSYERVLSYRRSIASEDSPAAQLSIPAGEKGPMLLVWGRMTDDSIHLEPAFQVNGHANLPEENGPYRLRGFDDSGSQLFSLSFAGTKVAPLTDTRTFAFALPAARVHLDRLARLTFSGPAGSTTRRSSIGPSLYNQGRTAPQVSMSKSKGGPGAVALRWQSKRTTAVLVRDARTGQTLAVSRNGRTIVSSDANSVNVIFSDGVRSLTRTVPLR